jgi:uncharacterized protein (TIGR03066 family)
MSALRLTTAGLLVLGLAAVVRADDKKADVDKGKLVGTWEVVKSDEGGPPPVGTVVTFTKDGKFKITHKNKEGKEETGEGTYSVDGAKLTVTMKHGDKEDSHSITIKKLTDTALVGEDDQGKSAELKRKS